MIDKQKKHGPYFMELVFRKVALDAIPSGGGLASGIEFLKDSERMKSTLLSAFEFVEMIIQQVQDTPDNPYGNEEEKIAKAILDEIAIKESKILGRL